MNKTWLAMGGFMAIIGLILSLVLNIAFIVFWIIGGLFALYGYFK